MRIHVHPRRKNATLATLIAIVVSVNASVLKPESKEAASPCKIVSDKLGEEKNLDQQKINYDGDQVWRVYKNNKIVEEVVRLKDEEGSYQIWSNNASVADIFIKNYMLRDIKHLFKNLSVKYDVLLNNVQQAIDEENPSLSTAVLEDLEGRKGHRMEWTTYHRLDDIYGYLNYLADTYPDICSVRTIGNSIEGRPLKLLRISNGTPDAPAIWIDGGIHAREWISPAAVTYIIDYLVENSDKLQTDFYILPVVNPDGYEYTFVTDRLWRKNRRKTNSVTGCMGIDLNRNFGYRWGGKGTSQMPCRDTYSGTGPFSEPETEAIRNFFDISAAQFKAYLTFHSYGQYILYPWGYDHRVPPDYNDLETVGRKAAAAMKKTGAGSVYTVGNSASTLYPAAGGSDDYAKALLKIKYAYTIELRDTGKYGFILPARYIIPTAKEALAAVEVVTEACCIPPKA
ncbi:carboxypeptidase B-like [Pseudomyrmex gracilis]|uniref:carboxypeptidase B-like n=1 Tax=Pseudomyrmex gracilis TaxID=219809 RepID=UPI0009954CC2|nr:carboxypeptidase B-like [Pseudomyrmex gracilis]